MSYYSITTSNFNDPVNPFTADVALSQRALTQRALSATPANPLIYIHQCLLFLSFTYINVTTN